MLKKTSGAFDGVSNSRLTDYESDALLTAKLPLCILLVNSAKRKHSVVVDSMKLTSNLVLHSLMNFL